jgi:FKBP-type peptidyl-prolyl cis-trans isomerase FkpA
MQQQAKNNVSEGAAFLAANAKKPGVKTTPSGLQYQVVTEGKGPKPVASDTVRVHYKGALLDGKTFDSSYDRNQPVVFSLEQVVPGWKEGIQLMPVGSKYKLWIPSKLGYGEAGTPGGPIGPNATLVFDVELLEIVKPGAADPAAAAAPAG